MLERDVDGIELRRLRAREHPLLAVLAQVNVSLEVVGIAEMGDESNQRIDQVRTFLAGLSMDCRKAKNRSDRFLPLGHDCVEMLLDEVGDLRPGLQTLGLVTIDRTKQPTQQLIDLRQMKPNGVELLGRPLNWGIGRDASDGGLVGMAADSHSR